MSDERQYAGEADLFTGQAERRFKDVWLPVKARWVRIRSLLPSEASKYDMACLARNNRDMIRGRMEDANRRLIVLCLVDGAGNCILNSSHVKRLATEFDNSDFAILYQECVKFSGVAQADMEQAEKNSEATSGEETKSDSPGVETE